MTMMMMMEDEEEEDEEEEEGESKDTDLKFPSLCGKQDKLILSGARSNVLSDMITSLLMMMK